MFTMFECRPARLLFGVAEGVALELGVVEEGVALEALDACVELACEDEVDDRVWDDDELLQTLLLHALEDEDGGGDHVDDGFGGGLYVDDGGGGGFEVVVVVSPQPSHQEPYARSLKKPK